LIDRVREENDDDWT